MAVTWRWWYRCRNCSKCVGAEIPNFLEMSFTLGLELLKTLCPYNR